jgi:mRNA-degrading endonuclease RelE of RelBE toxin-antitoxin system
MNTAYYDMLIQLQHQTKEMIRENTAHIAFNVEQNGKNNKVPNSNIYKLAGCDANKLVLQFDKPALTVEL